MSSSPDSPRASRLAELDALRGVAVLMVLAFHYTTRFSLLFPHAAWGDFPAGGYGPELFFVISGFVIVMTLERAERPMDFVVARFSRLYPAFWTAVLLTSLVLWLAHMAPPSFGRIAANLTMVPGFLGVAPVDGVYWTLEVELVFYALALALAWTGMLPRAHLAIAAWLALSALFANGPLARLLILEYAPFFAIGMLSYRLYRGQASGWADHALLGCAGLLILSRWPWFVGAMIAGACVVLWSMNRGGIAALRLRPLVFFGTISYPLYLLHQKVGYAVLAELARRGWKPLPRVAAATLIVVLLASAVTFLVEQPALQAIRRRYRLRRRRGPVLQGAA